LKKIFGHIFLVWFAFCFIGVFLVFYPLFLIFLSHPKGYPLANLLRKIWAWLTFLLTFTIPIYINENKSLKGPYVLVSNHTSYLDIVTIGLFAPLKLSFMAKHQLSKIPLFGIFFRTVDIGVVRESMTQSHKSFLKAKEKIENGYGVVIFPEGTIWKHVPKLKSFKSGAFKLAIETGVPILPVTFYNNFKHLPDERFEYYPGIVKFKIHRKIKTNHLKSEDAIELKNKIYSIIEDELKNHHIS
jgi:1-acyl-sn-glycerol-3-phosphate acyltransferase